MTLDRFAFNDEIEEVEGRRLKDGRWYDSRYIGPCRNCRSKRRQRRNLKKSPSIVKTLEGRVNKILKETTEKGQKPIKKMKVQEVKYFQFEE